MGKLTVPTPSKAACHNHVRGLLRRRLTLKRAPLGARAANRRDVRAAGQQGSAAAGGGSLEPTTAVETVSAWLARHGQDPEELQRQAPVWAALEWLLGSRQEAVALVRREPALLGMAPSLMTSNMDIMRRDLR